MYKCVIIDDEAHAIEGLKRYIETIPQLSVVKTYTDSLLALKEITADFDIIFLDVDMPKMNGIELAKEIRHKTKKLVFTTAHTRYAFEAFELSASGYLLKPYSLGKFVILFNQLFPESPSNKDASELPIVLKKDFFFVKSKEDNLSIVKIKFADVILVESKLNYVMIYTKAKNVLTHMSLGDIIKVLSNFTGFMQIHRSYVINEDHIDVVDGNYIRMINGVKISVGDSYRKNLNIFVANWTIKAGKP